MAKFPTFADLPLQAQQEITRILAINEGQRNDVEVSYLANRSDYLYNKVVVRDVDENILSARGHTLPSGAEGFLVGATFVKTDEATLTTFENIGDETSAVWLAFIKGDGAPVDYTDGDPVATGQDIALTGSRYLDYTNGALYINTGDADEPVWEQLAFVA